MYVTRPLSLYRNSPSALSLPPPEGPSSGILVIKDEAAESKWLFGMLKDETVSVPPFPQNKKLWLSNTMVVGTNTFVEYIYALFIPVLDQPPSSNQYYIIKSQGSEKGLAYVSSKDEVRSRLLGVADAPLQKFDPTNTYQQFEISNDTFCGKPNGFVFNSVASDGITPYSMTRKGWRAYTKTLDTFQPTAEALGLDAALRACLPQLTFSLPCRSSTPVVVGKWYCPFIFVRELGVDYQINNSPYYEMTLEQSWEDIFWCGNYRNAGRGVDVDVSVKKEVVSVEGKAVGGVSVSDGVAWLVPTRVGLSLAVVGRMRWEEQRGGFEWVGEGGEKEVKVKRREEFEGVGMWKRFGCYVLVERFVLKRRDGSLVLTWEFRHTHQIRTKWE
ncbi:uncharacterized protein LOC111480602 [Cucurbita maxima]|uniref:Uncharacterized protein LOC111480602 n=1 Tax=Cucurbita maxima TaxID=3661 RepID=A0A6J1J260_CUCMA|nr:uncharacterized protein LOC111480602 [Cucurbita maxima]